MGTPDDMGTDADLPEISVGVTPVVMTITQTADYFQVSSDTIRRLIKDGRLAHARILNSIRIPIAEADRYLAAQTTTQWKPEPSGRGQSKIVQSGPQT